MVEMEIAVMDLLVQMVMVVVMQLHVEMVQVVVADFTLMVQIIHPMVEDMDMHF